MKSKFKVAVYGGMFDPPHLGHLWIAQQLSEVVGEDGRPRFDRVVLMPNASGLSSKKQDITSADLRLKMCYLAVDDFNPGIAVMDYSIHYGLDYTYQVVNKLHEDFPDYEHTICVGDEWDVKKFKNYDEMEGKCHFLKIHRNKPIPKQQWSLNASNSVFYYKIGFELSSTTIRNRVRQNLPITGLVTPSVETFIKEKGLYKHAQVVRMLRSNLNHLPDKNYARTLCGQEITSAWEVLRASDVLKMNCKKCKAALC